MNLFLDTRQIHRDLAQKGGFNEIQADALTDVIRVLATAQGENLATKADLQSECKSLRSELATKADLHELRAEIATSKDLDDVMVAMATKADLQLVQQQLTIRFGGLIALGIGLLATIQQVLG